MTRAPYQQQLLTDQLIQAAYEGKLTAVKQAITNGAHVNAHDSRSGFTALHGAASHGRKEILVTLLEAGANPNAPDNSSYTPMHWAAWKKHEEACKILLTAGADLTLKGGLTKEHLEHVEARAAERLKPVLRLRRKLIDAMMGSEAMKVLDSTGDTPIDRARKDYGHGDHGAKGNEALAYYLQSVADNPSLRPTPDEVGLDMGKRTTAIAALEATIKPAIGQFTTAYIAATSKSGQAIS